MGAHSELVRSPSLLHLSGLPLRWTLPEGKPEEAKHLQSLNCSFAVGQNANHRKASKPMESALKTGSQYP